MGKCKETVDYGDNLCMHLTLLGWVPESCLHRSLVRKPYKRMIFGVSRQDFWLVALRTAFSSYGG